MIGDFVLYNLFLLLTIILPGWLATRRLYSGESFIGSLICAFAFGLSILALVGLILDRTLGITFSSLLLTYSVIYLAGFSINFPTPFRAITNLRLGAKGLVELTACLLVLLLAYAIRPSYFGFHSGDIGTHVFWANEIISTSHLPDYSIVRIVQSPSVFVFGPHFFLAASSILSGLSLSTMFWYPLVTFYALTMIGLFAITERITKSGWAGIIAILFYALAEVPLARVWLGNISDLIGYFLVTAFIMIALTTKKESFRIILLLFTGISVIVYYQYALLSLAAIVTIFGIIELSLGRLEFVRKYYNKLRKSTFWLVVIGIMGVLAGVVFAQASGYLSVTSLNALKSTNWPPISLQGVIENIGNATILPLGILGLFWLVLRREGGAILLSSWFLALLSISQLPILGIGVEPVRFIWHILESLSIPSAYLIIRFSRLCASRISQASQSRALRRGASAGMNWKITAVFLATTLTVATSSYPLIRSVASAPPQPYLTGDEAVGSWLRLHASISSVIVADAIADNSATWIQAAAELPLFIYNVPYNAQIASPPYNLMYARLAALYASPTSPGVINIIKAYNISYVVVPLAASRDFSFSLFFSSSYEFGNVSVFQPDFSHLVGQAAINSSYHVDVSNGDIGLITGDVVIQLNANEPLNISIPVHGQIPTPSRGPTTFNVYLDGSFYSNYTAPSESSGLTNLKLANLFPGLNSVDVSMPAFIDLQLGKGSHTIVVRSTSSILFEILLSEFKNIGIAVQVASETAV